jgi:uncharacterized delta-60 repeat protein
MSSFLSRKQMTNTKRLDSSASPVFRRRMFFEPLEERRVLASITLGTGGTGEWALDPGFGTSGITTLNVGTGEDYAWDVAIQDDEKVVVVGQATDAFFEDDFAIVRYDGDGTLDEDFGTNGIVRIDFGSPSSPTRDIAKAVGIDSDGRIVVVGSTTLGGTLQIAVVRLTPSGVLDTMFDGDGKLTANFGGNPSEGEGLAIQGDDKIVVVATTFEGQQVGVMRFNINGSLDIATTVDLHSDPDVESTEFAADIALDSTGRLIIAAEVNAGTAQVAIARLNSDGLKDETFDGDGIVLTVLPATSIGGTVSAIAVQSDGGIIATGTYFNDAPNSDVFLIRYDSTGALVTTFGSGGIVVTPQTADQKAFDVALQGSSIVVAGATAVSGTGDSFLVNRYTSAGVLDDSFTTTGGRIETNLSNEDDKARAVTIDSEGRIVVAGSVAGESQLALARYKQSTGGPPPTFSIDENGQVDLKVTYTTSGPAKITINWGDEQAPTTHDVDAGSGTITIFKTYLDDNPTGTAVDENTITASIKEEGGNPVFAPATAKAIVSNVDPAVNPINGPTAAVRGQSVSFTGSFTDVGTVDTHCVFWDFGDGTMIDFHPSTDPGALTPSHIYSAAGTYTVTLIVKDDDTGETTATRSQTIVVAQLEPAPCGCGTALVVGGTNNGEVIQISSVTGGVELFINAASAGVFNPSHAVVVHAYGGNDDVQIAGSVALSAWIYGGDGDDRLKGGAGADMLQGQLGHDLLVGGAGRDLLIGGIGQDRIVGNSDDDILVSGTTDHDDSIGALCSILAEWNSSRWGYERVANIYGVGCGTRLNGNYFLNDNTVHDDGERDVLTGSSGFDWFFANLSLYNDDSTTKDIITDQNWWEFAKDIDFIEG